MPAAVKTGGASTIRSTKAGQASSPAHLSTGDLRAWRDFLHAAIAGITSAHRRTPNPDMVVRLAAQIADRAMTECDKRSKR